MDSKENCLQKFLSLYETHAKSIVLINLVIEIIVFIACCIIFLLFNKDLPNSDVYKGMALITLFLSMLYFAYHSILLNNVLELFSFIILSTITTYSIITMLYGIANDPYKIEGYQIYAFIASIITLVNQIFYYLSYIPIYNQFVWLSYKQVGASKKLQKYYLIYQSFQTLIKVYFQISLISFWTFYVFMDYKCEYVVDSLILAGFIMISWFCFISTKHEKKKVVIAYLIAISCIEVYKTIKILFFMYESNFSLEGIITDYNSRMIAIFAEISCILSCFGLIFLGVKNIQSYGDGLRDKMLSDRMSFLIAENTNNL